MSKYDDDTALKSSKKRLDMACQEPTLKKCEICGEIIKEPNDLETLMTQGPAKCPHCYRIHELRAILNKHAEEYFDNEIANPVEEQNQVIDSRKTNTNGVIVTTSHTSPFDDEIIVTGRTKAVRNTIKIISEARHELYVYMDPYLNILESFYERKDRFWQDGENLTIYTRNAVFQLLILKIREYLGGDSKYSITKIRNIITMQKKDLYERQRIVTKRTFRQSGDVAEIPYPRFRIDEYLLKIDDVLESYKATIDGIIDVRNNLIAHFGKLKNEDSKKEVTFRNVKRIFNSLKIIYNGFLYSVAPDLYKDYRVYHRLPFDRLNEISQFWADHKKTH